MALYQDRRHTKCVKEQKGLQWNHLMLNSWTLECNSLKGPAQHITYTGTPTWGADIGLNIKKWELCVRTVMKSLVYSHNAVSGYTHSLIHTSVFPKTIWEKKGTSRQQHIGDPRRHFTHGGRKLKTEIIISSPDSWHKWSSKIFSSFIFMNQLLLILKIKYLLIFIIVWI